VRKTAVILMWIVLGMGTASSPALTITGQVVDSRARPVAGRKWSCASNTGSAASSRTPGWSARWSRPTPGPVCLEADVTTQREAVIVARKPGLAYAWEWLNSELSILSAKHVSLVLEPACTLTGQVVDLEGRPVAGPRFRRSCKYLGLQRHCTPSTAPRNGSQPPPTHRARSGSSNLLPMAAPACGSRAPAAGANMYFPRRSGSPSGTRYGARTFGWWFRGKARFGPRARSSRPAGRRR